MVKYTWIKEKVPQGLNVRQVYGVVFSDDGKIILRVDNNKYKLTGGKPEKNDKNLAETLKREYLEELNIEIEDIYYLGYLLVEENKENYAQVRMIGKIKEIKETKHDDDNGKIYKRFLANTKNVKKLLDYPDLAGNQLVDDAIKLAIKKYNLNFNNNNNNNDEYFI